MSDKDIFWSQIEPDEKYWTLKMGDIKLQNSKGEASAVGDIQSKHIIMDTGVSYALLPVHDFKVITSKLAEYGVECTRPKNATLVSTHTCTCPNFSALPDIQMNLVDTSPRVANSKTASKPNESYVPFILPKESYMASSNGRCKSLRLTPATENFGGQHRAWVMGGIFL